MPISNMQWREEVGIFNATSKTRYLRKSHYGYLFLLFVSSVLDFVLFLYYYFYLFMVILNLIRVLKTGTPVTISQSVIGT